MCDNGKLAPTSCSLCADCNHCIFEGEYNEFNNYAHCLCNDLDKEFWVNLKQFPNVVEKTLD